MEKLRDCMFTLCETMPFLSSDTTCTIDEPASNRPAMLASPQPRAIAAPSLMQIRDRSDGGGLTSGPAAGSNLISIASLVVSQTPVRMLTGSARTKPPIIDMVHTASMMQRFTASLRFRRTVAQPCDLQLRPDVLPTARCMDDIGDMTDLKTL